MSIEPPRAPNAPPSQPPTIHPEEDRRSGAGHGARHSAFVPDARSTIAEVRFLPRFDATMPKRSTNGVEIYEFDDDVEVEVEDDGSSIVNPFDPEDIDIISRTPNVNSLLSRLRSSRLDLEPDFQRKSGIWNDRRKSRLIESLLLRIPVPTMYAAEAQSRNDRWVVVDGVQRISTIASFVDPDLVPEVEFTHLSDLEYLKDYEGATFNDLPPRLQTRIDETEFTLNLIRRGTPEPVMFNIFARINTGGTPLTRQEIRHALTPGVGRSVLRRLAESETFKLATGGRVPTDRMQDREMILRFIAFDRNGLKRYNRSTDFDTFLTDALKRLSETSVGQRKALTQRFTAAAITAHGIFGEHAFRKSLPGYPRRAPINKALFECVMVSLANLALADRKALLDNPEPVLERFGDLLANPNFLSAVSQGTGDVIKTRLRHRLAREAFDA